MTDLRPEEREILLNHLLRLYRAPSGLNTQLKTKTQWSLDNYPENLGRPELYVALIDDLAANESLADLRLVMVRENQITPAVLELDDVLMAWKARAPRRRRDPANTARERRRQSERRTSQTLLHCRIVIDPVDPDESNATINARFGAMMKRMAGCARRPIEVAVQCDDGFLVRFLSPVDAVKSGLIMQRATTGEDNQPFDPNARVSFGLSQAELFAERPIPMKEPSVEIASVLASLGEHQQLLVTGAVFGSVSGGAALEFTGGNLGTAEHGDYEIAVLKRLVNVCELADLRIRQTSAPEGSGAAHSAQRPLETAGFFDLVAVTRAGTSIVYYGKHANWPDTDLAIKVLTGGQQLDEKARDAFLAAAGLLKGKELPESSRFSTLRHRPMRTS